MRLSQLVPNASGDITIPQASTVTIDRDMSLGFLDVRGVLKCISNYTLSTDGILINGEGAELRCGTQALAEI